MSKILLQLHAFRFGTAMFELLEQTRVEAFTLLGDAQSLNDIGSMRLRSGLFPGCSMLDSLIEIFTFCGEYLNWRSLRWQDEVPAPLGTKSIQQACYEKLANSETSQHITGTLARTLEVNLGESLAG